jgi:formyl-CoA transferase
LRLWTEPSKAAEQILASEALVPFADGSSLTVNSPIWISGQQKTKPRAAPSVGENNEGVLREAGYSDAEIRIMRADGVIR